MREHPILFSGPMVRALLSGTNTQTRRAMKPQMVYGPVAGLFNSWYLPRADGGGTLYPNGKEKILAICPYGRPGDRLWVREAWAETRLFQARDTAMVVYREADNRTDYGGPWKPSIHMRRRDSRILLEITDVRVERLQDITDADCVAEGCGATTASIGVPMTGPRGETVPRAMFRALWESINGAESWAANPWVWAVSFKRVLP